MVRFNIPLAITYVATLVLGCNAEAAFANEIRHFTYNARGELVVATNVTGPNDGLKASYVYDSAMNRTSVVSRNVRIVLNSGMSITSQDGRFQLIMQTDGNLVLYFGWQALWAASSNGPDRAMVFQGDGNLVVYGPTGAVWSINMNSPGAEMSLQNDGNLVIRDVDGNVVWQTNTGGY